jgi:hypothetical protein
MGKNLIGLVTILLVLGPAASAPASLVAHWKLDEKSGTTARDSSTNARHATVGGTPNWVAGMVDGALDWDGTTNYLDVNAEIVRGTCTVALWLKPRDLPYATDYRAIVHNDQWDAGSLHGHLRATTSLFNFDINPGGGVTSTTVAQSEEWYHLTATFDTAKAESNLYVNGTLEATSTGLSTALYVGPLNWGAWTSNQRFFNGVMDDIRVYSRALTAGQVQDLANGIPPTFLKAEKPDPADGATAVINPLLMWTKGETAMFHDVYFGTTPELTEADLKASRQFFALYYHAAGLVAGTTYFWRIDEIAADGAVYTGDVWSFATAPATAYAPVPRDGDKWIDLNSDLSWKPGHGATKHDVYFSTDQAAVANRDTGALQSSGQTTVTFEPGALAAQTTYYWAVDEQTMSNATYPGDVWQFTTTNPGVSGGVKGEYFNGMTPTGVPALTRIDPAIDFSWGDPGGPGAPIGVDGFSARWTADLEIAVADTYTFITNTDDGARLWLNDKQIINQWVDQGPTAASSAPMALEPGVYSLRMEYYENTGGTTAQLLWESPSMPRQIIPAGPLQPPVRARALYPQDNDVNVPQDAVLMWGAGESAVKHQVYLGEDETAVAEATTTSSGIYRGTQTLDQTTFDPGGLEWNKTYYWRIDEVNDAGADSPWTGSVWSFTTADFLVVDDFESYNDEDGTYTRIYENWIDGWVTGNGATVGNWDPPFAEQTIVHGGRQSMPFDYNNLVSPFYSEAYREFAPAQNWTVNGVTDLSLWVRGYPGVQTVTVTETAGKMTVTGAGADIWLNSDEFTFAFKRLSGAGSMVARVVSSGTGTNTWAKGGVMIRDSLNGGSTFVDMVITGGGGNGASFQWRPIANQGCQNSDNTSVLAPPYWVKIERTGDDIAGYYSADGSFWTQLGITQTIAMSAPVYIGICVTSHVPGEDRTFEFDSIKTTGGVSGNWQGAIISAPVHNSQQPLYVMVEDSTGKKATVTNPDPGAVNVTAWTEWKIPLSDLAGVNLTKVKKLYLGVGDKSAVGNGKLFIDDIRVTKPEPTP